MSIRVTLTPYPEIPGDREDRIIARSGQIVGWSSARVLWRFGFLPGSDAAKAYGVSTEKFTWILCDYEGHYRPDRDVFVGYAYELPARFKKYT